MSTVSSTPRRRLSSRRGSQSAPDPYGLYTDAETAQAKASRITILPVRAPHVQNVHGGHNVARDRSSWGSAYSASSNASTGRGRLSFAFTSFTPVAGAKAADATLGTANGPPSPGGRFARRSSSHSLDRASQQAGLQQHLTPQQVCDLAVMSISNPPPASPTFDGHAQQPTPFLLLSDEQYLPFLERPAEVTALVASSPTNRLMALLQQTFPNDLRAAYDPAAPPEAFGEEPEKWSFGELMRWLQTVDRDEADDREWVSKARRCVLSRSELIWSRLKAALGVPPELEEDDDEYDDDEEERVADYEYSEEEREALLEPIYDGDRAQCVASPVITPSNPFDSTMESIGEGAEDEDTAEKEKEPVDDAARAIHGLRLSTAMTEVDKPRSRSVSPVVSVRRALSSAAAPDDAAGARRREALSSSVSPGRVRRSAQQERGTGDPLFPSSFATLTMGPSLVANNPALRSGPHRTFRPGVPITGRRGGRHYSGSLSGGWDTDGNDYALSLGSGSERSFVGR